MKIKQLLTREPFAEILVRTLKGFWSERYNRDFDVVWGAPNGSAPDAQSWSGNATLNFFATPATPGESFNVIRREYGRSVSRWKRPAQWLYVRLGTSPRYRHLLSNVSFHVVPPNPDGGQCLVMGGNHRLRILNPATGRCTVILKAGGNPEFISNELTFREANSPSFIPALFAVAASRTWFVEQYVNGIGLTRLPPERVGSLVEDACGRLAREVVQPSLRAVSAQEWSEGLAHDVERWMRRTASYAAADSYRDDVCGLAGRLADLIRRSAGPRMKVGVSWSHGDFQLGNIVHDGTGVWVVDWESTSQRFVGYDPLTMALGSRARGRLAGKVRQLLAGGDPRAIRGLTHWPGLDWCAKSSHTLMALYLLEEMVFHLKENADPTSCAPTAFFRPYFDEIAEASTLIL